LNPALYEQLTRHFGTVRVTNQGIPMIAVCRPDPLTGRPHLAISEHGEQYTVNCKYCSDTRFRLSISHRYAHLDEAGRRLRSSPKCFNEDCLSKPENRDDLWETVTEFGGEPEEVRVAHRGGAVGEPRRVCWPGTVTRLDELPGRHKARRYVRSRGFDPD